MRSLEEVLQSFLDYARSVKPDGNWAPHSVLSELVISIPAQETWRLWVVADYVRKLQTFQGIKSIIEDTTFIENLATSIGITYDQAAELVSSDLDNLAADWGFTRKASTYSYGTERFYFESHGTYTIPQGTMLASGSLVFSTLHDVIDWSTTTKDGRPAIDIPIRCETVGSAGNVGPRTINTLVTRIDGVTGVTNPYGLTGGSDQESDLDFVNRIISWLGSMSQGTVTWLQSLVFGIQGVQQVKVVTCREDDVTRFPRNYGADIWVVVSEEPVYTADTLDSAETLHYALQQPVIESLTTNILPTDWTFTRNYPYNYITNTSNMYSMSIFGSDRFTGPALGPGASISYYYDRTIERIQTLVSDPEYWFLGGESLVLVRKAVAREVNVTSCEIWLSAGYTSAEVEPNILNDLNVFFAGGTASTGKVYSMKGIGEGVDHSDLLNVILDVEGVDRVNLDTFSVSIGTTSYDDPSSDDPLPIKFFEYPVLGTVNLTFH